MPLLARKVRIESACAGLASDLLACKVIGLPFTAEVVSEIEEEARAFVVQNIPEAQHIVGDTKVHGACSGYCSRHARNCTWEEGDGHLDILCAGPPCQPFSAFRQSSGDKTPVAQHRLFPVTFGYGGDGTHDPEDSLVHLVKKRRPAAIILEQVEAFAKEDQYDQTSSFKDFLKAIQVVKHSDGSSYYKGAKAFKLNASQWIGVNPPRFPRCAPTKISESLVRSARQPSLHARDFGS
jgi:site-specific DNA-cytosine methylase